MDASFPSPPRWGRHAMALMLLAASLPGCATQLMHHNLGSRLERGWIVDRVVQTHRRLVVFYRAERVTYHAWFATTDEVSRWASIHLDTIHWRPITQFGTLGPGPQRTLFKEAEPPPRLEIPPDREIPVLKMAAGSRDDELHALQSTAANHALSALCRPLEPFAALKIARPYTACGGLVLLMAEPYGGTMPGWALLDPPGAMDRAWWAIPARILVTPATLMIDAVLVPWAILQRD